MQDDMADGVKHLFAQGIADRNRSCIMGWSYGGYKTFTASFKNGDLFKCAVAGAGVSDLVAMQRWTRDGNANDPDVIDGGGDGRNSISYKYWTSSIGDIDKDRDMLNANSAAQNAAKVAMPLMIIHGDQDEIVPIDQSEIMAKAMDRAGKPYKFVRLKDTNHNYTMDQGDAWRTVLVESLAFIKANIGPGVTAPAGTN
jgi:dipeptidyl aminopeptidase/acylaminoacyl peptidase